MCLGVSTPKMSKICPRPAWLTASSRCTAGLPGRMISIRIAPLPRPSRRCPVRVCRQRRSTGRRLRARYGGGREVVAERLVGGSDVRGRILGGHAVLRRQGRCGMRGDPGCGDGDRARDAAELAFDLGPKLHAPHLRLRAAWAGATLHGGRDPIASRTPSVSALLRQRIFPEQEQKQIASHCS